MMLTCCIIRRLCNPRKQDQEPKRGKYKTWNEKKEKKSLCLGVVLRPFTAFSEKITSVEQLHSKLFLNQALTHYEVCFSVCHRNI